MMYVLFKLEKIKHMEGLGVISVGVSTELGGIFSLDSLTTANATNIGKEYKTPYLAPH